MNVAWVGIVSFSHDGAKFTGVEGRGQKAQLRLSM